MKAQQILIAGPYRSGTDGDPQRIAANLARLEQAALAAWNRRRWRFTSGGTCR